MKCDPLPGIPDYRPIVCDVCGRCCTGIAGLLDHYIYKHKEKP